MARAGQHRDTRICRLGIERLETRTLLAGFNLIEQFPKFLPESVPQIHEYFGSTVAIDGNRAIIGARQSSDISTDPGVAYVYEKVEGRWQQVAMLKSPVADRGAFGSKVAIDGDTIVVAAQGLATADEDDEYDNTGAVYVFTGGGASWSLQGTITPRDEQLNDGFGQLVDIDGDRIAVASRPTSRPTSHQAHLSDYIVQVYERVNTEWIETYQTDSTSSNSAPAYSGVASSLAIDGNVLAVGSRSATSSGTVNQNGAVFIHERRDGVWSYSKEIAPPNFGNNMAFGAAIALDDETLIVGVPYDTSDDLSEYWGSACVYHQDGEDWNFVQRISVSELGGALSFGSTLALDGDSLAVVGQMWRRNPLLESVHLFYRGEDGLWSRQAESRDEAVSSIVSFGVSVGLSGNTLLVGSPFDDTVGNNDGAVFAYELSTADADVSVYAARQSGLDLVEVDFGSQGMSLPIKFSVYKSADSELDEADLSQLVTEAYVQPANGANLYSFDPGEFDANRPFMIIVAETNGVEHTLANNQIAMRMAVPSGTILQEQLQRLIGEEYSGLGADMAIDENWAVVGAPYDDRLATDAGAAYLFERVAGHWVDRGVVTARNGRALDEFGRSVAIDQDVMVIGAQYDSEVGRRAGAAYVYKLTNGVWIEVTKLLGMAANDSFGNAVAVENGTIVVGAHYQGYSYNLAGAVYVYEPVDGDYAKVFEMSEIPGFWEGNYWLGEAVDVSGERIAVGAAEFSAGDDRTGGAVVMLERIDGAWQFQQLINMPDGTSGNRFGESLGLWGETLVVGAPEKDFSTNLRDAGAAYIYQFDDEQWHFVQKLTNSIVDGGGFFGRTVEVVESTIYVRGWHNDPIVYDNYIGTVSIYHRSPDGMWVLENRLSEPVATGEFGDFAASEDAFFIAIDTRVYGVRSQHIRIYDIVNSLPSLTGDYNLDSRVDSADYSVWRDSLGTNGLTPYSGADGDGDGAVDQDDYLVWKANFGRSLPTGGGAATQPGNGPVVFSGASDAAQLLEPVSPGEHSVTVSVESKALSVPLGAILTAMPVTSRSRGGDLVRQHAQKSSFEAARDIALLDWCSRQLHSVAPNSNSTFPKSAPPLMEVEHEPAKNADFAFSSFGAEMGGVRCANRGWSAS
jgi:hypothetical protein